jgi:hypothetical protein
VRVRSLTAAEAETVLRVLRADLPDYIEVIRFLRWQMRFFPVNPLHTNIEDTLSKAEL